MIALSYSTMSTLIKCGAKIVFKNMKIKGPLSANLAYGSVLHYALNQYWTTGADPNLSAPAALDALRSGRSIPGEREQENWDGRIKVNPKDAPIETMKEWIPKAAWAYIKQRPQRPLATEMKLERDMQRYKLLGYVDALHRDGSIVDYKLASDRYTPDPVQMGFYAILMGGPVKAEFHVIRKGPIPEIDIVSVPEANDPSFLAFIAERMIPQAVMQLEHPEGLVANPAPGNFLCSPLYCEYWNACLGKYKRT